MIEIATAALGVSLLALYVSARVAWDSRFRPGKLVGQLGTITLWTMQDNSTKKVTDFKLTPDFWIRNIGAKPLLIEDLRLRFATQHGAFDAYPLGVIESDADLTRYIRYLREERIFDWGKRFIGFGLTAGEVWDKRCVFSIPSAQGSTHASWRERIVGSMNVEIAARFQGSSRWKVVICETYVLPESANLGPFEGVLQYTYLNPSNLARQRGGELVT